MHLEHTPYGPYERWVKRPLDAVLSLIALILLSPVLLITAILVRTRLGSPVIFTQERPGRDGKVFRLCKFRSMSNARDRDGNLLPDEQRITRFGRALRASSLDELPELWNILKGDMALIGPRPLLVKYLPYYTKEEMRRHSVRPGLTGNAQVNGRNEITWERKFALDLEYVDHITFREDWRIVKQTLHTVFSHEGTALNAIEDFDVYRKKQWEAQGVSGNPGDGSGKL